MIALAWAYLFLAAAAMQRGDMSLMGMSMPMPSAGDAVMPASEDLASPASDNAGMPTDTAMPSGGSMPMDTPTSSGGTMPMEPLMAMDRAPWTTVTFALHFLMWWVMMIGMMIPSALPAILLYSRVQHHYLKDGSARSFVASFVAGYLLAWAAFSALATAAQWTLAEAGLISQMSMSVGAGLAAVLFAAAGLYQLSPLKNACLRHCRAPAEFISQQRRPGRRGACLTGAHHGLYCVGCCWLLMALLFAGGVMNLLWVAALTVFVLLEKVAPRGHWIARGSGVAMLGVAVTFGISALG